MSPYIIIIDDHDDDIEGYSTHIYEQKYLKNKTHKTSLT